jgi:hypothetical protein
MSFDDPFAEGQKTPAVSLKDVPVGGEVKLHVTGPARKVQSREFETGQLAYWDEARTQPKYSAVLPVQLNGEDRALWAQMPSALFAAISAAQAQAGQRIDDGGTLTLKRLPDTPNAKNPRLHPQKQWVAKYEPPAVDAFGDDQPPF